MDLQTVAVIIFVVVVVGVMVGSWLYDQWRRDREWDYWWNRHD